MHNLLDIGIPNIYLSLSVFIDIMHVYVCIHLSLGIIPKSNAC